MDPRAVIVGAGQLRAKPGLDGPFDPQEPAELMARALRSAAADSGQPDLVSDADALYTVSPLAWSYDDLPAVVAGKVGAQPQVGVEPLPGGDSPITALNEIANKIRAGQIEIALLAGAETVYGRRRARKDGIALDHWTPRPQERDIFGGQRPIANELEMRHGLVLPIQAYPLYENALRAAAGRSLEEHQAFLGQLMARYSDVATKNPYSWFPEPRTAKDIASVGPENRWVCFPYTKRMNALMEVDQGAACIVMSDVEADRRGIPADRRVGYLGGAKGTDAWTPTERRDFVSSPGYAAAARETLSRARLGLDEIDRFDLYSCFPSAVELALGALALAWDDPRGLTVTGGLAHHGGPGNSYSLHALANMTTRLRSGDGRTGFVSGLGMTATKHAICALSTDVERVQRSEGTATILELPESETHGPELAPRTSGPGTVETYTVQFGRDNRPERSFVVVRLADGRRTLAHGVPTDFERFTRSEGVGLAGEVRAGDGDASNEFALGRAS